MKAKHKNKLTEEVNKKEKLQLRCKKLNSRWKAKVAVATKEGEEKLVRLQSAS